MNRLPEDEQIHEELQQSMMLAPKFTEAMIETVLKQVERIPWWERELRIPWQAVASVLLLLIAAPLIGWYQITDESSSPMLAQEAEVDYSLMNGERLVVMGGAVYLESELLEGWPNSR